MCLHRYMHNQTICITGPTVKLEPILIVAWKRDKSTHKLQDFERKKCIKSWWILKPECKITLILILSALFFFTLSVSSLINFLSWFLELTIQVKGSKTRHLTSVLVLPLILSHGKFTKTGAMSKLLNTFHNRYL